MKALVTGGGGFLGGAIVRQLLNRGDQVRSFSRGRYPELDALGVDHFHGDITDAVAVATAAEGCDVLFHVAAKAGIWGSEKDFFNINITGTVNVIEACRRHQIRRLVYTSSPSVIFNGKDMEGVDESEPYPEHYEAHYPKSKAIAEQKVLDANNNNLSTVALRPHLIWGPHDNHLVPRILAKGKSGRLRKIGQRPCLVDCVYIDNAAEAHLLAADRLSPRSKIAGKTYFISQGEPRPLWEIVNGILDAGDLPPVTKTVSPGVAYAAGRGFEALYKLFRIKSDPPMTRFLARELSTAHWFDLSAAKNDLNYEPKISIDEGMLRLKKWLQEKQKWNGPKTSNAK